MKTVYRNAGEVLHIWAQQGGHDVRCSNAHTNGTALYSYSTPIANFLTNDKGKTAVLITTRRYSTTTSANMPSASDIPGGYAIGSWYNTPRFSTLQNGKDGVNKIPVFHVEHVGKVDGRATFPSSKGFHADNMLIMQNEYMELLKKLSRAKANAENYVTDLGLLREKAQAYGKFFRVTFNGKRFPVVTPEVIARAKDVTQKDAARKAKQTAERNQRNRERAEMNAAAYIAGTERLAWETKQYVTVPTLGKIVAKQAEAWIAGGESRPDNSGITLLRVRGDEVETSRGATFPLAHGLKALPYIRAIVASGEAWHRNGKTIHLGAYQIDSIEGGVIVAGCHELPVSEVERLAASLGV